MLPCIYILGRARKSPLETRVPLHNICPLYTIDQYGPPESKSCLLPVFRKIINGAIAMASGMIGAKKFNPKIIGEKEFITNTTMDQKMIGRFLIIFKCFCSVV